MADNVFEIEGSELYDDRLIFRNIVATKEADLPTIDKLRVFLIEAISKYMDAREAVANMEYKDDPEIVHETLARLHRHLGGLMGLADSIHRRIKSTTYLDHYHSHKEDKKPPTAEVREYEARNASADLEGIVRMLDVDQSTLFNEMAMQSGRVKRR